MYINGKADEQNTYDAIVVGSGISGGWAAKELTEKGLKTIMLERGENIEHIKDYPTATLDPWQFQHRGWLTEEMKASHPVQKRDYPYNEYSPKFWVNDLECPYTEVQRFDWYRGYHVGGRSLMWGRQSYRLSDLDFEANQKEGIAVDWPIRYNEIAPWYSYAEKFAGISGQAEGLHQLPDGDYLPPMELNAVEKEVQARVKAKYGRKRIVTIGRTANLTEVHLGRNHCQYRNLCSRGCPYGAYFSTQSATLPAAVKTGNLTLRPYSIVHEVILDEKTGKAKGVRILDAQTRQTREYFAKVIFLNASTLNTAFILLNSKSGRYPNGMGNDSGQLGKNLMDHHFKCGASGEAEGFDDLYYFGRRPNGIYIPRFRNVDGDKRDYVRGFGYQGGANRDSWTSGIAEMGMGGEFKDKLSLPGKWHMGMTAFGECLPYEKNRVTLNTEKKDKWGLPTLSIDCSFKENEMKMRKDMMGDAAEILEASGLKNVKTFDNGSFPGQGIHEMGTARMGRDPKTSVLNAANQIHTIPNVYVTDGACMTSASCVNPSLTYMALTARAAEHAVSELKKMNV